MVDVWFNVQYGGRAEGRVILSDVQSLPHWGNAEWIVRYVMGARLNGTQHEPWNPRKGGYEVKMTSEGDNGVFALKVLSGKATVVEASVQDCAFLK